jgi:hypothetical protein
MPAILRPEDYAIWLGEQGGTGHEGVADLAQLRMLLRPWAGEMLRVTKVSSLVNKPQNESPSCVEPLVDDFKEESSQPHRGEGSKAKPSRHRPAKHSPADSTNRTLFGEDD